MVQRTQPKHLVTSSVSISEELPVASAIGQHGCVQKALKKLFSVQYRVNREEREATIVGSQENVEAAIVAWYGMMDRIQKLRVVNPCRLFAIVNGPNWTFTFERCAWKELGDVDMTEYSFVLRQKHRQDVEDERHVVGAFVNNMNDTYVDAMGERLKVLGEQYHGQVRLKATLGEKLYQLRTVEGGLEMSWNTIRDINRSRDVRTAWSSLCVNQTTSPWYVLSSQLHQIARGLGGRELMTVTLNDPFGVLLYRLKFIKKEDGLWFCKGGEDGRTPFIVQDIFSEEAFTYRVHARVFNAPIPSETLRSLSNSLQVIDGENGISSVHATPTLPKDICIAWSSYKVKKSVPFGGLDFALVNVHGHGTSIQCSLPKPTIQSMNPAEQFKYLYNRLGRLIREYK